MTAQVGQPAPDFTLYDNDKNKLTLSELKGSNVLLLFFPVAFTSVCTAELCAVRDNLKYYESANARVFGISVDSIFALNKFKHEQNLNFPLLSDFNKEASKAYGSLYENWKYDMLGVSKRSAFVVDKEGVIRYAEVLENAGEQPNFEAINQTLQTLS
ncbi:redoxin domain-containing protein [Flavisolibacter tropicus]|uniref:Peroxiredoxin n=1 Tax=Flavisolibacter tropicus TaxID=1492898 RepID=A0A172TUQ3_9BACT|nr:redoxin domain-containing protein [Flavisolibacter tropicus]ANE50716.1 peroxiredoxin [Flavisolibacter tropicus]